MVPLGGGTRVGMDTMFTVNDTTVADDGGDGLDGAIGIATIAGPGHRPFGEVSALASERTEQPSTS